MAGIQAMGLHGVSARRLYARGFTAGFSIARCTPSPCLNQRKNMIQFNLGYRTVCEAVGNGGSALSTLQGLAHCANQSTTVDIFAGAVGCLVSVFQSIKAHGLSVPQFNAQHLNEFLTQPVATMSATLSVNLTLRHEHAGQQVAALCVAVDQHRGKISFNDHPLANVADQPVDPAKPSAPIEVVIVGMVTRETTTEIQRNRNGEIESTSQVERDVLDLRRQEIDRLCGDAV
jgi:hypothetical protein